MRYWSVLLLLFSTQLLSAEFEKVVISGYEKEVLSSSHLRFFKKNKTSEVIHLQLDTYDSSKPWKENSFKKDINEMFSKRIKMYSIAGITQPTLLNFEIVKIDKMINPAMKLSGTYVLINKKKVWFEEMNLYYKKRFLQIKVIDQNGIVSPQIISSIISEIKPTTLEVDNE
jgi:hypothetical protein